ncbi:e7ab612f-d148-4bd1-8e09-6e5908cda157 [Thermothielavioides terrestris]|uniref:E7ab612f-d148-4bd1-8e09-6e5908cda157 n=1 Tax=Thermothielavioides terrestris TaxID=2587410 RepID=A0A446BNN9_9PEZI|nr:e7ab612f-d148-4bd1-8e09-6e5908cda157 [Thermothielavioides terrestris]
MQHNAPEMLDTPEQPPNSTELIGPLRLSQGGHGSSPRLGDDEAAYMKNVDGPNVSENGGLSKSDTQREAPNTGQKRTRNSSPYLSDGIDELSRPPKRLGERRWIIPATASSTPGSISWQRFPTEIRLSILEALLQTGPSLASFATVSREWQTVIERHNFSRIKLTPGSRLAEFGSMVFRNRALVRYIWFCIELDAYDCSECEPQSRDPETWGFSDEDNVRIVNGFEALFSTLGTWEPRPSGEMLQLDISIHSPSDSEHWFKYLTFEPDLPPEECALPSAEQHSSITNSSSSNNNNNSSSSSSSNNDGSMEQQQHQQQRQQRRRRRQRQRQQQQQQQEPTLRHSLRPDVIKARDTLAAASAAAADAALASLRAAAAGSQAE